MITIYQQRGEQFVFSEMTEHTKLDSLAWIDAYNITSEEEKFLESRLGIDILTRDELWKNRVLSRFYKENGVYYLSAAIITKTAGNHPQTSTVTFILAKDYFITVRYIAPTSFLNFAHRLVSGSHQFACSSHLLEGLLSEMIGRVVHNSSLVMRELDQLSHAIFNVSMLDDSNKTSNNSGSMKSLLKTLGAAADLNSQINESLHSIQRLLVFFQKAHPEDKELNEDIHVLMSDVGSLTLQTSFLSDKITFLLDAIMGMINVEQNIIIKVLSVAAVLFMPPTLISSIYGMNFRHMPELEIVYAYPIALFVIGVCLVVPYIYFRRRHWV